MTDCNRSLRAGLCVALFVLLFGTTSANADYDLDTGNAPAEVVIPRVIPAIYQSVSAGAGDATLVLRITTMITNAWFDAIAPYHASAVGVYSRIDRRPASEGETNYNKNVAILHASYHVLNSLLPGHWQEWHAMLTSLGLDPDDTSTDVSSPVGIGNVAGKAVVAARERDGMNQLGDEGGRTHNPSPYSDYLGYQPVNTAYDLRDPSRWQPDIRRVGTGIYQVQQFATPQMRVTRPYSYADPNEFRAAPPVKSRIRGQGRGAYKQQADEVLAVSATLTDEQKMIAELFDDKLLSLGFSAFFVHATKLDGSIDQFVHYDFLVNVAAFDGAIATWNEKYRHDAVRPFSAIRYLYGDRPITAWGGPGRGTDVIPASQWQSYMGTADHPEYPSGSACFCSAHAQASRRWLGSDEFGWAVPISAGSSKVEPGITPASNIVLGPWGTWTDFEQSCGLSRVYGGVHFYSAIEAGHALCRPIGDLAYEFVRAHVNGTAPPYIP
jgi:hypothetical protein